MRQVFFIVLIAILSLSFVGCGRSDKSKIIETYKYEEGNVELNDVLKDRVGSWIKEGIECYGLVMVTDAKGNVLSVNEIKAVVLMIEKEQIKMKTLEQVNIAPVAGCSKMEVAKGETWWEKEGDLFQTREEAIKYGKTVKIKLKPSLVRRFTVD